MLRKIWKMFTKQALDIDTVDAPLEDFVVNKYYKAFTEDISWFNHEKDPVEFYDVVKADLSLAFKNEFPTTSQLYEKSTLTGVKIGEISLILLTWELSNGALCGWMCEKSDPVPNLLPEHTLLNNHVGGIIESFNGPESIQLGDVEYNMTLCLNQNFMFISKKCGPLPREVIEEYKECCYRNNCEPIDLTPMITFAQEANGNRYFYNIVTKEVWLMAYDHFFNFVKPVEGQPEYTVYYIDNAPNFTAFVELLSSQWLKYINTN